MRLGTRYFRPSLASTLAVLLLLPLLLAMGFWQLDRAEQKAKLQAAFAEHFAQAPVALTELMEPADTSNRYFHVSTSGYYDGAHQLLLDNQVHDGQPGYHVLTPLRVAKDATILINRGWVPLGASRKQLPQVAAPSGLVTLSGWLAQPAFPGMRLGDATGADRRWPRVIPYVDYPQLSTILGYSLQPVVILLAPEAPDGYWRDWQPRFGGLGPDRHRGYAVQWFALAVALITLYGFAGMRRSPPSE